MEEKKGGGGGVGKGEEEGEVGEGEMHSLQLSTAFHFKLLLLLYFQLLHLCHHFLCIYHHLFYFFSSLLLHLFPVVFLWATVLGKSLQLDGPHKKWRHLYLSRSEDIIICSNSAFLPLRECDAS